MELTWYLLVTHLVCTLYKEGNKSLYDIDQYQKKLDIYPAEYQVSIQCMTIMYSLLYL